MLVRVCVCVSVPHACVYRRSGSRSEADIIIITKQKCRSIRLLAGTASVAPTALPLRPFCFWLNAINEYECMLAENRRHVNSFSFFAFDFIQSEYFGFLSAFFVFSIYNYNSICIQRALVSDYSVFLFTFHSRIIVHWLRLSRSEANSCLFSHLWNSHFLLNEHPMREPVNYCGCNQFKE